MIALRHLFYAIVGGLFLCFSVATHGMAQTASSDSADALAKRDNEMRIVNAVLSAFSDVMESDERAILQEADVRIPMDYDITRVVAYRDGGRAIDISFGFYGVLIELCRDWILAEYSSQEDRGIYDKYEAYLAYVNGVIDRNELSIGEDREHVKPFEEFAGISEQRAAEIMSNVDAQEYYGNLQVAAIAFVLAHEIGHHVLGHVDSPPATSAAESREREAEADRYATSLTMRAGIPAFGALPALAIFAGAEGDVPDPDSTHPFAACRIVTAMMDTVDWLAADERYVHLFDNTPEMLPGGSQYQDLRSRVGEQCS